MATIKTRFEKLDSKRQPHLERQRKCAALTLPALLPPNGRDENHQLDTPWQSLGARGTNNLASKLLLTVLPPNSPFFRLVPSDKITDELKQQDHGAVTAIEKALADIERRVLKFINRLHLRVPLFRALKLLIVTGNCLCYVPNEGGMVVYRLDQYVVVRDRKGNVIEIIIRESVSPITLPDHIREMANVKAREDGSYEDVEIYTMIKRTESSWEATQEINGIEIEEARGSYELDACPWIPLRWSDSDGENYGRGLVDENLGDLISLENLTETIIQGSASMAKLLFLVNPNGTTRYRDLAETPNTGFAPGVADDVTVLQANKHGDFQVALATRNELIERLSQAFLAHSSVQRNAERVTAEEIRFMASELEDALGGVYSLLSQEWQLPFLKRIMEIMKRKGMLPQLPKDALEPVIVTGIEALGRGHDLNKLGAFLQNISILGPEAIMRYLVIGDYITRVATALGIDTDGLIRTEEELAAESQNQMIQAMIAKIGPDAVNKLLGGAVDIAKTGAAAPPPPQAQG